MNRPEVVVVTGGSAGIGRAAALAFAKPGNRVAVLERAGDDGAAVGVNTPQFDWARNKLPHRVQPVPPIFQPELAADAIRLAARRPRREVWVGWPAVKAILSSRLVPGLGDRLAVRQAFGAQQAQEAATPRPDNLFDAVPGAHGAHGRFDEQARGSSLQWSLSRLRWLRAARGAAAQRGWRRRATRRCEAARRTRARARHAGHE